MNIIQILGNLGADPEVRYAPSGQKITTFTVASNTRKQGKDETTWYRVTIFGDRFDKLISYLKKGSSVIAIGKLNPPRIWTDREGRPQVSLEIIADMVEFSPFGKSDRSGQEQTQAAHQAYPQGQAPYSPQAAQVREPAFAETSYGMQQGNFGGPSSMDGTPKPSSQEEENVPF